MDFASKTKGNQTHPAAVTPRMAPATLNDHSDRGAQLRQLSQLMQKGAQRRLSGSLVIPASVQQKNRDEDKLQLKSLALTNVNGTGLPDNLKAGIESLSGISMDHVQVHRNSSKPAQLNAHAYARGGSIHLGPGQDKHLPHEAWHIVQQAQGRVKPTFQMKTGVQINDDQGLEQEADEMGAKALQMKATAGASAPPRRFNIADGIFQLVKVVTADGEKEIEDLTPAEMNQLMLEQPILTPDMEREIRAWIAKSGSSHVQTRNLNLRLTQWKNPEEGARPKPKKKRKNSKGSARMAVDIYDDVDDSELSEPETDFEKWSERKAFGMTPVYNRGHVPTADDEMGDDVHITGMHHADTYLAVKQGGQFVPRTINGKPNVDAHRKLLPEERLVELAAIRDDETKLEAEREAAGIELKTIQQQLLFGNAIDWAEGGFDEELVRNQESHREELRREETPVGRLMTRGAIGGVRSGSKAITSTDAEQRLLSSKVWKAMLMKLMAAIDGAQDGRMPFEKITEFGIQILLNRSSCLGCGKALALALVDFWKAVATVAGFKTWRAARDQYLSLDLFQISFPVIYEYRKEKKIEFRNIMIILAGLNDAGWTVRAPKGIESTVGAEENHQKLRAFLAGGDAEEDHAATLYKINGKRYDVTDPRIRHDGACLWDVLHRIYHFPIAKLEAAAGTLHLTYGDYVDDIDVWPLLQQLGASGMTLHSWQYGKEDEAETTIKGDGSIVIGLAFAPDGLGHFIPPQ